MKVLVAMDSFKGSLSSMEACDAVERGILGAGKCAEVFKIPMADGGEGTVKSLIASAGGYIKKCRTTGLFDEEIEGYYGVINHGKTAVVETAVASGITLVDRKSLNPLKATTFGTGAIIADAVKDGFRDIIVALGGSGTNDGGMGALQALGVKFFDNCGHLLGHGGEMMELVSKIDTSGIEPALKNVKIRLACDVDNCFFGDSGAAYVFAPQKGADEAMVKRLDNGLRNLAQVIAMTIGKDISGIKGSGAAGGLCGGLLAFTDSTILPGFEILREASDFDNKVQSVDLVITGEGKTDFQTAFGKLPVCVARVAGKFGKKVVCISGCVEYCDELYNEGISGLFSVTNKPMSLDESMKNADTLLEKTAFNIIRLMI